MAIGLAVGAIAGCPVGVLLGAPRPLCPLRRPPSLGHYRARLLSCLPLLWLTLLMRGQALVQGVHPPYRLPSLLWRQIAV